MVSILKSDGLISEVGRPPSATSVTDVTPLIVIELRETDSTFAKVVVVKPGFEKDTRFPTVAMPVKIVLVADTVLIPALSPVILTCPIEKRVDCKVSPVNVYPLPTIP